MKNHIAILDFGSQYTHLISRNIREKNVSAKIYPHNAKANELSEAWGIIISGGPQTVGKKDSITIDEKILEMGVPVLGICYGHQLLAHILGGKVQGGTTSEYGKAKMKIKGQSPLFKGIDDETQVWMSHGDSVTEVPKGFSVIGSTDDCEITAMANEEKKFYGIQFHAEVDHSAQGGIMIENFVFDICNAEKNWEIKDIVEHLITKIKKQAKDRKVFVLVSGGVDSNVAFCLLTRALGEDRVKGLYIDTGFMRHEESEEILDNFKKAGFNNLEIVDASETFFKKLEGIFEPEEKRHIIGQTFLDVKEEVSEKLGLDPEHWMLGQGTIYPDTIESGDTKSSDKIKTHHNRVDSIAKLIEKGMVIEPLIDFYKYEVRMVGELLGLPQELIDRHPFPGPGLAIRCLCQKHSVKKEDLSTHNEKIEKVLKKHPEIEYALLPIKSVGVQGDNRTYAHPLAVWGEKNWEILDEISVSITNKIKAINRGLLLLNPEGENVFKLPQKDLFLTKERIEILKEIDHIVSKNVKESGLYDKIWQFPVVLLPITDENEKESIVLRPVNTRDAMTLDFFRMPENVIEKIVREIKETGKISHIFYDITNKPPGTTEWE